ncbi:uncharacterized protein LOC143375249 [Andrena cerasifolii]|uniref:uncharacterized protein LOC143375249 n=1 Tax=Andrena cerasifolii TaxID=2819439 RepID=UPI004038123F
MSRKAFPGRASLSFATTDGILDIDQILSTTPWNQIDDYVQRNFMQEVLNDFNEQMALDPKRVPTDATTEGTHQEKSPRCNTDKNRNTVEMGSNDPSSDSPVGDGNGNITSAKETTASISETTPRDEGRGSASDAKERANRAAKGEKGKNAKLLEKRGKEKKTVANGPRARTRSKRTMADLVDNETEAVMHGTESAIEEPTTPGHTNAVSPFKTSTPNREHVQSSISNSTGKGETIECERKNMSTRCQGNNTSEPVATADRAINNRTGFRRKGHGKYETPLREKRPKKPIPHVVERKHPERCQKSVKKEKKSDPNKKAKKTAGKLPKSLREGERKRRDWKIQQRERKAERAFKKLGLQVNSIVKRMGYLPGTYLIENRSYCRLIVSST